MIQQNYKNTNQKQTVFGMWDFLFKIFKQYLGSWLSPMDQSKRKLRKKKKKTNFSIFLKSFSWKYSKLIFSLLNNITSKRLYFNIFSTQSMVYPINNTDITLHCARKCRFLGLSSDQLNQNLILMCLYAWKDWDRLPYMITTHNVQKPWFIAF